MLDPTLLEPGTFVSVMVTGQVRAVVAEVTSEKDHGWAVLRVVEPKDWPPAMLLKCEDYIPLKMVQKP